MQILKYFLVLFVQAKYVKKQTETIKIILCYGKPQTFIINIESSVLFHYLLRAFSCPGIDHQNISELFKMLGIIFYYYYKTFFQPSTLDHVYARVRVWVIVSNENFKAFSSIFLGIFFIH